MIGLIYKIFMSVAGSLCALMMLVVNEFGLSALLAGCVLLALLEVPERVGRLVNGGDGD